MHDIILQKDTHSNLHRPAFFIHITLFAGESKGASDVV
jgi:hypothetical protein